MPRQNKKSSNTPEDRSLSRALAKRHPSKVAGLFVDDPTFEEFCDILRQRREEDYQQASTDAEAAVRHGEEARRCSSSTQTPSHTTDMRTPSSAHE